MKKTLFLSGLLAMVGVAAADSTTITIAGQDYSFENVTNLTTTIPTGLDTTGVGAIVLGNATRTEYNIQTNRTYKDHDVLNGYNGTIVIANGTIGETAVSGGQLSLSLWGNNQIEGSYRLNANLLIGASNWSEGSYGKNYGGALRLNDTNAEHHITLAGQVTLADNAEMTVGGTGNYIDGNISGAGKSFMLKQSGTLHLSGGATLGTLSAGNVTLSLDATKEDGTESTNKVYNIGTLTSNKAVTLGEGVALNLSSGASSVLSFGGTGTVNVGADAALTITSQAVGTQNFSGAGSVTMTLAGTGTDVINAGGSLSKLSVLATASVTGHDTTLTVNNFSGVLELTGRFDNGTTFGSASKLVLHGTRSDSANLTTGFWGTSDKTFDLPVEIDGEEFVDLFASAKYTFAQAVSGNKLRTKNGKDVVFDGTVNLHNFTDNNNNVFFNENTTIAELVNNSNKTVTFATGKTHVVDSVSGSGAVVFNAGLNVGNGKTMAFSGSGTTTASDFASLGSGAHVTLSDSAKLVVKDASSGKGVWIGESADITISGNAQLKVEKAAGGTLTINADGSNDAVVSRRDNTKTAKLGVSADSHKDYLKNVKVVNGVINYTGSDILYLGSMEGGSLTSTANVIFAGANSAIGTLTLNGNSITLGSMTQGAADYHENYTLTLDTLIVGANAGSTINANLVIADNGTLDFSAGQTLTMGCEVTLGSGVTVLVSGDTYQALADHTEGVSLTLFEGVSDFSGPAAITVSDGTQSGVFFMNYDNGSLIIVPEPATTTLSLLALAGLCARRKRH